MYIYIYVMYIHIYTVYKHDQWWISSAYHFWNANQHIHAGNLCFLCFRWSTCYRLMLRSSRTVFCQAVWAEQPGFNEESTMSHTIFVCRIYLRLITITLFKGRYIYLKEKLSISSVCSIVFHGDCKNTHTLIKKNLELAGQVCSETRPEIALRWFSHGKWPWKSDKAMRPYVCIMMWQLWPN